MTKHEEYKKLMIELSTGVNDFWREIMLDHVGEKITKKSIMEISETVQANINKNFK